MKVLKVRNVNEALWGGFDLLRTNGVPEQSRNGPVLRVPGPVTTHYEKPLERVLFEPRRDCNHVFHLMEALWMIAGQNDVRWLLQFNSKFDQFAEEGIIMHGAYGHRWRRHFSVDQLLEVVDILKKTPSTRQAVIGMWDPRDDLVGSWKDRPCNTHIYFEIDSSQKNQPAKLNMLVSCRSNDILWGAYGSNVVHFSILQELIASVLDVEVGWYEQMSFNYHCYTALPMVRDFLRDPPSLPPLPHPAVVPLLGPEETLGSFLIDCSTLVTGGTNFCTAFFQTVVDPMMQVYLGRRAGKPYQEQMNRMANCDWKYALQGWIDRRQTKENKDE